MAIRCIKRGSWRTAQVDLSGICCFIFNSGKQSHTCCCVLYASRQTFWHLLLLGRGQSNMSCDVFLPKCSPYTYCSCAVLASSLRRCHKSVGEYYMCCVVFSLNDVHTCSCSQVLHRHFTLLVRYLSGTEGFVWKHCSSCAVLSDRKSVV